MFQFIHVCLFVCKYFLASGFSIQKCLPSTELYEKLINSIQIQTKNSIIVDWEKEPEIFNGNATVMEEFLSSFESQEQTPQVRI